MVLKRHWWGCYWNCGWTVVESCHCQYRKQFSVENKCSWFFLLLLSGQLLFVRVLGRDLAVELPCFEALDLEVTSRLTQDVAAGCNLTAAWVTKVWTGRGSWKWHCCISQPLVFLFCFSSCLLPMQVFIWTALWSVLQTSDFQMLSGRLSGILPTLFDLPHTRNKPWNFT